MRPALLALALALPTAAMAQTAPLSTGLNSGVPSGFDGAISSGLPSGFDGGLGSDTRRTMADGYYRGDRNAGALNGGGCAPTQFNYGNTGCQPIEALRSVFTDPNRSITYFGGTALGQNGTTYTGDSAFRSQGGTPDPNRPF